MLSSTEVGKPIKGRPGYVRLAPAISLPLSNAMSLPGIPIKQQHWNPILIMLCDRYNQMDFSFEKIVSYKTQDDRKQFLFRFFKELRRDQEKSYRIDPRQLGDRHVRFAFKRWFEAGLSPATIQKYLSHLRVFELWIGKRGMVRSTEEYAGDPALVRRSAVALEDKTWKRDNIDVETTIARVSARDPWVGAEMRLQVTFGARVRESIMFRPHKDAGEEVVTFFRGTKGGRKRQVRIETDAQREALAAAKALVKTQEGFLADPARDMRSNYRRFYYICESAGITRAMIGVTAHGLRHTYACAKYEAITGTAAPVRGGEEIDPSLDKQARLAVAKDLGHARKQIAGAYVGAVLRAGSGRLVAAPPAPSPEPETKMEGFE
jgi:integrase